MVMVSPRVGDFFSMMRKARLLLFFTAFTQVTVKL
jgi:hypothetical protein